MTLRGLLMWCLGVGSLVFIGVAGASGFQLLARQHGQRVAEAVSDPVPAVASIASSPIERADTQLTPHAANPSPASPLSAPALSPARGPAAALLPPLRQHITGGFAAVDQLGRPERHAPRRSAASKGTAHRLAPRPPSLAAAMAPPHLPGYRPDRYEVPRQPGIWYPPPPAPPVAYYPYRSYYGYRSGYAYYAGYPRYPYDPAY
jgi:hypothetical protein